MESNNAADFEKEPNQVSRVDRFEAEPFKILKPAGPTNPSTAGKVSTQDIWKGTSFTAAGNKPSCFQPAPAADLEAKSKGKSPVVTLHPAEVKNTPKNPEAGQRGEATDARKEAASGTTRETFLPMQFHEFNFGGNSDPVSFTGSLPSFPAQVSQPTSTGIFSFERQSPPLVTIQPKEKTAEDGVPKDVNPEENMPKEKVPEEGVPKEETREIDAPENESPQEKKLREKKLKKKMLKEESARKKETPKYTRTASEPSRNQKRRRKSKRKLLEKAEREAHSANAQASRRVQQALMMR